jgi:serine/threonine-protein kinase BUR1
MEMDPPTVDLFDKLLTLDPRQRITAAQALDHDYFWTDPLPADPKTYVFSHSLASPVPVLIIV